MNPVVQYVIRFIEEQILSDKNPLLDYQLQILDKRLVVKYARSKDVIRCPTTPRAAAVTEPNATPEYLNYNFLDKPPPHLLYSYPEATPSIVRRIGQELKRNIAFYTQVLHLMNRMNLKPPFTDSAQSTEEVACQTDPIEQKRPGVATDESELESSDEEAQKHRKRKSAIHFKDNPKKLRALLVAEKRIVDDRHQNGDNKRLVQARKIVVNAPSTIDVHAIPPSPIEMPVTVERADDAVTSSTITLEDLLSNRIPAQQLKDNPIFLSYDPGRPSNVLYLKNLAKTVTEEDLRFIYGRYGSAQNVIIDLKTQGRLRGQAFIHFNIPYEDADDEDVKLGQRQIDRALKETHGYILKNKAIYVCYAKSKNK